MILYFKIVHTNISSVLEERSKYFQANKHKIQLSQVQNIFFWSKIKSRQPKRQFKIKSRQPKFKGAFTITE